MWRTVSPTLKSVVIETWLIWGGRSSSCVLAIKVTYNMQPGQRTRTAQGVDYSASPCRDEVRDEDGVLGFNRTVSYGSDQRSRS
ncbi:hypothetical protein DFH94DRAFT_764973 [Russula ochroleuca]|uniref:Uncharacterized protein n=1 Tax=Russula ochroleuca TaxID=152965 RepID=A0A9P5K0W9_9AGAM|nr:hypothetical protein DFH94DRAFT_764973 [Russula ochroleuca]